MLPRPEEIEQLCDRWRTVSRTDAKEAVQAELERILDSTQFRASQRGRAFLTHVVSRALACEFDVLKERMVGIELFGRDSQFDTDRDSVVRVAASDVRRRLQEYYRRQPPSGIRIGLRSGTYIPALETAPLETTPAAAASIPFAAAPSRRARLWQLLAIGALTSTLALALWIGSSASASSGHTPFWSPILQHGKRATVVMADANLVLRKVRTKQNVPIDSYTSNTFEYLPDTPGPFSGYLNNIPLTTVSDAMLATRIGALATRFGCDLQVRGSRKLQLADLKREEPLIFLGSAMSDPWVGLLHDQLNFKIEHRYDTGIDVVVNASPRAGESAEYAPYRDPLGVFIGYAIVARAANLRGNAPVLVIAGTSTEGTEAAGEFATDLARLEAALAKAGARTNAPLKRVEFVLRTSYMSATSAKAEIIAYRVE